MNRRSGWKDKLRSAVRGAARPVVAGIRRWIDPPPPPATLQAVKIVQGPLAGQRMMLPFPSDLADIISQSRYETTTLRLLPHLIAPGDVCYDIGGHYGVFSMHMALLSPSDSKPTRVHTFEPIPRLASCIEQSIGLNAIHNITLHRAAVSDRTGTLTMRAAVDESGDDSMAYVENHGGVVTPRSIVQYGQFAPLEVQSITLDQSPAPPPQFIKMDIEGAEVAAITGACKLIAEHRPRLLIEVHGVERALALTQLLGPLGYIAWQVGPLAVAPQILWLHRSDLSGNQRIAALRSPTPQALFGSFDPLTQSADDLA